MHACVAGRCVLRVGMCMCVHEIFQTHHQSKPVQGDRPREPRKQTRGTQPALQQEKRALAFRSDLPFTQHPTPLIMLITSFTQPHSQPASSCCAALRCTALHCAALRCTALHCAALRCTAMHCTAHRFLWLSLWLDLSATADLALPVWPCHACLHACLSHFLVSSPGSRVGSREVLTYLC
jgi:hypothetical protein